VTEMILTNTGDSTIGGLVDPMLRKWVRKYKPRHGEVDACFPRLTFFHGFAGRCLNDRRLHLRI